MDTQTLARNHLVKFVRRLQQLIAAEPVGFDLLVGAGNSGIVAAYLAERVFQQTGRARPPMLTLPVYRHVPRAGTTQPFDNLVLLPEVRQRLQKRDRLARVLFVDDEIASGTTAIAVLRLLRARSAAEGRREHLHYFIVAEDQGFLPPPAIDRAFIHFRPYAREIAGLSNVLAYIIPLDLVLPIQACYDDAVLPFHHRMNILLGLPLKEFGNGNPVWSFELHRVLARNIPHLHQLQEQFRTLIDRLIATTLR